MKWWVWGQHGCLFLRRNSAGATENGVAIGPARATAGRLCKGRCERVHEGPRAHGQHAAGQRRSVRRLAEQRVACWHRGPRSERDGCAGMPCGAVARTRRFARPAVSANGRRSVGACRCCRHVDAPRALPTAHAGTGSGLWRRAARCAKAVPGPARNDAGYFIEASRLPPSGTGPPRAPPGALRGSPRPPATGRGACRRRRTPCRRWWRSRR